MSAENAVKKMFPLEIKEENISAFIGRNGSNIKKYVIGSSKKEYFDVGEERVSNEQWNSLRLGVHIESDEKDGVTRVIAKISVPDQKAADIVREKVFQHQTVFLKKLSEPKRNTFYFNVNLRHNLLGKIIGSAGTNIKDLKEKIYNTSEDGETPEKYPMVQISEGDGRENTEIFEKNEFNETIKVKVVIDRLTKDTVQAVLTDHLSQYQTEEVDFSGDGFEEWE